MGQIRSRVRVRVKFRLGLGSNFRLWVGLGRADPGGVRVKVD